MDRNKSFQRREEKIVEQWQEADQMGLMQQLSESVLRPVTEPLGRRETEALQQQVDATAPREEVR